jgi:hypothetical protein
MRPATASRNRPSVPATNEDAGRTGLLQTDLCVPRKHHAPRRARFSPVRSPPGGALARLFRGRLGPCPEQRVGVSFAHGAGGADRAKVWRGDRADYL